jgi:hypothetical protein
VQLFGDLDILSLVRVSQWNWIGHVNRMDSKGNVSQVFNNNSQGRGLRGLPKSRWWNFVRTGSNKFNIKNGKRGKTTQFTGRNPLRRRRAALDCSAIE